MQKKPDVLWLSVSPYLKCFDQRLMSQLTKRSTVRRWKYCQTIDEPCSTDTVVEALHEYLSGRAAEADEMAAKVHIIGHGVSGVIGLLYARQYPQHVASLTLLSVSSTPAVNWQAHYYALRKLLPCSRETILGQMTRLLFGPQAPRFATALAQLLAKDLDSNLTLHSLAHHTHIPAGGVEVPLMVCNGEMDDIVSSQQQADWTRWFKTGADAASPKKTSPSKEDRMWLCPGGRHFFHFYHYKAVAKAILDHWAQLKSQSCELERSQNVDAMGASLHNQLAAAESALPRTSDSAQSSVSWC